MLRRTTVEDLPHADNILTPAELAEMRKLVRQVIIAPHGEELAADFLLRTHPESDDAPASVRKYVRYGASPRGAQAMVLTAKARALLAGRYNVSTADIITVASREVTVSELVLEAYRSALSAYTTSLESFCRAAGIGYTMVTADASFEYLLMKNLIENRMAE